MNKDDIELFKIFNKRVHYPMIVTIEPRKLSLSQLLSAQSRAEVVWQQFYPINEDKMLMGFVVGDLTYSIEVFPDQYHEQKDSFFTDRIHREIKEIISGKEKFYFIENNEETDDKREIARLTSEILDDHKNSKPIVYYYRLKAKEFIIVGLDKAHLARTIIYICNKK
jgi:hypothetical protein